MVRMLSVKDFVYSLLDKYLKTEDILTFNVYTDDGLRLIDFYTYPSRVKLKIERYWGNLKVDYNGTIYLVKNFLPENYNYVEEFDELFENFKAFSVAFYTTISHHERLNIYTIKRRSNNETL